MLLCLEKVEQFLDIDKYKYLKDIETFVYCGGKCGSKTLYHTLEKSLHVHSNINFQKIVLHGEKEISIFDIINYNRINKKQIYIIDSYRTPIERKISSFFENIRNHLPNYKELSIESIIDYFNAKLLVRLEEYHSIDEAFKYFRVEPFSKFDFEKKYIAENYENITFIKIRFQEINEWEDILSKIFNRPIIMINRNLTQTKEIFNLYTEFKKLYKVPKSYIHNQLANDAQFKIYNSQKEQYEYINKWLLKSI